MNLLPVSIDGVISGMQTPKGDSNIFIAGYHLLQMNEDMRESVPKLLSEGYFVLIVHSIDLNRFDPDYGLMTLGEISPGFEMRYVNAPDEFKERVVGEYYPTISDAVVSNESVVERIL